MALHSLTLKIFTTFIFTFILAGVLVFYFEHDHDNKHFYETIWDGIWWGIVTITTTGYGDKYPVTLGGRIVAGFTMCIGIVSAGIVTGNMASWLVDLRLKEGRGILNLHGKSNHLVICGWKREMDRILDEILVLDPNLKPSDIVIVAPISFETIEAFKANEKYAEINILRGEYFTQTLLEHASIQNAKKILVLADRSDPSQSLQSIDSKTVMTAMTVRKLAPEIYMAAELIDSKLDTYLKLTHCDEIMHTLKYSQMLLSETARTKGIAPVLFELLNTRNESSLSTLPLPNQLIGRPFQEAVNHYQRSSNSLVLGLLENTGNIHKMKKAALAEAQKNPDTRDILRELKQIKKLKPNTPVINPDSNYVIKKNSMVIAIQNRKSTT